MSCHGSTLLQRGQTMLVAEFYWLSLASIVCGNILKPELDDTMKQHTYNAVVLQTAGAHANNMQNHTTSNDESPVVVFCLPN